MKFNFLNEISRVTELYKRHSKISGENFNIFSIMSMESDEVFTHSALLAELLNPQGSHGLDSKPLMLFIKEFLDSDYKMNLNNAVCRKEDHIGFTNSEKSVGGRVDILLKDLEGNVIIIENKINAAEQVNQLLRYKTKYPHAELFYLTLDGKESDSINNSDETEKIYRNLSYEKDIIPWISSCAELAYNKPMLREVLNQYILLLKKLTNQTTNIEMAEQITKIITENFDACLEINKNFEKVILNLKQDLLISLCLDLKVRFPLLNFAIDKYREVQAITVTNFDHKAVVHFRFKNQKWPIISVNTELSTFDGTRLPSFHCDAIEGKVWWKRLSLLSDEMLGQNKISNTKEVFLSELSKVIEVINSDN